MAWITGHHAIRAAMLRTGGHLYVDDKHARSAELVRVADGCSVAVSVVSRAELTALAGSSARGAALEVTEGTSSTVSLRDWLAQSSRVDSTGPILVLDHVVDPQNYGAILRSALAFRAALVIVPSRRSAISAQSVAKASAGAAGYVAIAPVSNIRSAVDLLKRSGWWTYAAVAGGRDLSASSFDQRAAIILGAESTGVSRLVEKTSDQRVGIPIDPNNGAIDSLNVSVAAAILLYEYRRQYPLVVGGGR